jgi:hypothetical protein
MILNLLSEKKRMSLEKTPQIQALPCGGFISTVFTFQSVQVQNAANSVYVQKSTVDGQYAAANPTAPKKYTFKSDYERMQYILGCRGTVPGASGY